MGDPAGTSRDEAFDAWVRDVAPRLRTVAVLLHGDVGAGDRALHDALTQSWRAWPSPPPGPAVPGDGADALEAAEQAVLRRLLALALTPEPVAEPGAEEPVALAPVPPSVVDLPRANARAALRARLAALPPELRAVLVLHHADGRPLEEVAAVLQEPLEQVQRADAAALRLLARDPLLAAYVVVPA